MNRMTQLRGQGPPDSKQLFGANISAQPMRLIEIGGPAGMFATEESGVTIIAAKPEQIKVSAMHVKPGAKCRDTEEGDYTGYDGIWKDQGRVLQCCSGHADFATFPGAQGAHA